MKFKTALFQNILLVIGVSAIFKFLSLRNIYSMFQIWTSGMPIIDGEGIELNFLGIRLSSGDEGIHWTRAITAGNAFLIFGVILIIISISILIWKTRRESHANNIEQ